MNRTKNTGYSNEYLVFLFIIGFVAGFLLRRNVRHISATFLRCNSYWNMEVHELVKSRTFCAIRVWAIL